MAKLTKVYAMPGRVMQDNFPHWMFFSRSAQILLSIIILALDAFVIDQASKMNKSSTDYNAYVGLFVGGGHFANFTMFTTVFTLLIIAYVLIGPRRAPQFYHVYGELALESLLVIFWLATFAGMADYISKSDGFTSVLDGYLSGWVEDDRITESVVNSEKAARDSRKAIAGLGALVFLLSLANSVFLGLYCLRKFRARKANTGSEIATKDNEVTMSAPVSTVQPQSAPSNTASESMPPGFSGHEENAKPA